MCAGSMTLAAPSPSLATSAAFASSAPFAGVPPPFAVRAPPRSAALSVEARRAFGGLLPIIDRPELRDVMIHVADGEGRLWIDIDGRARQVPGWRIPPETVRGVAIALIAAGGRHIDELHPCADVRLGDGIRVHAVLPPACVEGAAISIRVPRVSPLGFDELVVDGLCSPEVADTLRTAVARRRNLLVTGGTGSGKTTLLAALLDLVPPEERIITIEDVAELRLAHLHRVALEARQANTEGAGELPLERLLREALRMRPDRIVLGECRGAELLTLLAALNTGHDGGAGTLHASGVADVPARLEALGALAGLPPAALARQAYSALHLIVHLERRPSGRSRVAALGSLALHGDVLAVDTFEPSESTSSRGAPEPRESYGSRDPHAPVVPRAVR